MLSLTPSFVVGAPVAAQDRPKNVLLATERPSLSPGLPLAAKRVCVGLDSEADVQIEHKSKILRTQPRGVIFPARKLKG